MSEYDGKPLDTGGALTIEMIEEAAIKSLENFGKPHEWYVSTEMYDLAVRLNKEHPEIHLTCPADIVYYAKKFGMI